MSNDETKDMNIEHENRNNQVMKEAEEYFDIARAAKANKWRMENEEMYIINRKWMNKWKEYVNYPFIKRKKQYSYAYNNSKLKPYDVDEEKNPGIINNEELLIPLSEFLNDGNLSDQMNLVVREDINQREEIKICTKKVWDFFHSRYGGGPTIVRQWIPEGGSYSFRKVVELFYRSVSIILLPKRKELSKEVINSRSPNKMYISRTKSLPDVKNKFVEIMNNYNRKTHEGNQMTIENIRLWKIDSNSSLDKFKDFLVGNLDDIINTDSLINPENNLDYLEYIPKIALKDLEYADTDVCIVEFFDEMNPAIFEVKKIEMKEGKCESCDQRRLLRYFCSCKDVGYCSEQCKDRDSYWHNQRCKKKFQIEEDSLKMGGSSKKGIVGLQNLGNTCFMNTSLQCMSNCYELTQYFLNDHYKSHINHDNPIGTQGVLAKAYSNLLKNIWFGSSGVYSPWNFKSAIATFQSMFTGYQQHDTQEFLNYLLDGLHEDLNKVLKKPIVEKDDSNKEDKIKASEQWIGFLRRNQSALVDLLYGQYKSTLYCPDPQCQNISTTFDPFLSLTLPLVKKEEKYDVTCFFIFYNIEISPIQIQLTFHTETTVMAMRNKIARLINVHPFSFLIMKMDSFGDLDFFVNSSMLVRVNAASRYLHKNQIPFFCFQINPEVFYSRENNILPDLDTSLLRSFEDTFEILEKSKEEMKYLYSEDHQENESGQTKEDTHFYSNFTVKTYVNGEEEDKEMVMKYNTDNNNGLTSDWIKLVLHMRKYDDTLSSLRKKLIFPRIIYVNKKWSTKYLHSVILNYYGSILRRFHNVHTGDIWDTFFPDLEETILSNADLTFEEHRQKAYPYLIRVRNIFTSFGGHCVFCERTNCNDCLLPCSDGITVEQMLEKIPKNRDMQIDNTYYYLNEKQRDLCPYKETDFMLDVSWLPQYVSEVRVLNDKKDFEIQTKKSFRDEGINIHNCFKNFISVEKLEANNEWYCPRCKQHQRAEKKMEIYKSPHILIIHLKRFKNNSKIDCVVDFPVNGLDISNYVIHKEEGVPLVYDLFAIANHYGGLGGGHYVAYAKNYLNNNWYCFNDSSVSSISEDSLVTAGAYVLFYRRRDLTNHVNLESIYTKTFEDYENLAEINNLTLNSNHK